jgi:hypothetical protein
MREITPAIPDVTLANPQLSHEFLALCGLGLGLVAILGAIIVAITIVMTVYYRRTQLDDMNATLKMEMIQRGMSADEIERVLKAKMGTSRARGMADVLEARMRDRKLKPAGQPAEQA